MEVPSYVQCILFLVLHAQVFRRSFPVYTLLCWEMLSYFTVQETIGVGSPDGLDESRGLQVIKIITLEVIFHCNLKESNFLKNYNMKHFKYSGGKRIFPCRPFMPTPLYHESGAWTGNVQSCLHCTSALKLVPNNFLKTLGP